MCSHENVDGGIDVTAEKLSAVETAISFTSYYGNNILRSTKPTFKGVYCIRSQDHGHPEQEEEEGKGRVLQSQVWTAFYFLDWTEMYSLCDYLMKCILIICVRFYIVYYIVQFKNVLEI